MTATTNQFFVYGTLMSGHGNSRLFKGLAEPVSTALCRGDLYAVGGGGFPAMLPGDGVVVGELWRALDDSFIPEITTRLDRLEGFRPEVPEGSMYLREEVELLAPATTAWTYIWNERDMRGLDRIDGGDFRLWDEERRWNYEADRYLSACRAS